MGDTTTPTSTTTCRSPKCRARIDFAVTEGGRTMPVDHDSADDPSGMVAVWRDGDGVLRCRAIREDETLLPGEHRGVVHWLTCKGAIRCYRRGQRN